MRAVYLCCDGLGVVIKTCVCKQDRHAHWSSAGAIAAGLIGLRVAVCRLCFSRVGATLPYMPLLETWCALQCFHRE